MHKIVRCSHLISHYFSKTIVEKKRIVDIYLLKIFLVSHVVSYTRWVGRQDSVGPAPPFFGSGGPQIKVWWTKMEGVEFTDDMKIEFEPNKR